MDILFSATGAHHRRRITSSAAVAPGGTPGCVTHWSSWRSAGSPGPADRVARGAEALAWLGQ